MGLPMNRRYVSQAIGLGAVHWLVSVASAFYHFALSFSQDHYARSWMVSILSAPVGLLIDPTDLLMGTSFIVGLAALLANSTACALLYYAVRTRRGRRHSI